MDTSDPLIQFFGSQGCTHCLHASRFISQHNDGSVDSGADQVYKYLRAHSSAEAPVLVGLSGGVDSAWVLHSLTTHNINVLALHVDTGWNSPEAVLNISKLCNKLGVKLITQVVDWNIMKKLQTAYFYSGVINQDMPQDIAIFSAQYSLASENNISLLVTGANNRTESILPPSWGHHYHDLANINSIYKSFWNSSLKGFPFVDIKGLLDYRILGGRSIGLTTVNLFDQIEYSKSDALSYLVQNYDYTPYSNKHGESLWTLYYQTIYLPDVYKIDKRRAHLSNLIVNREISRSDALAILSEPMLSNHEKKDLAHFISVKLGISFDHAYNPGSYLLPCDHDSFSPGSKEWINNSWGRIMRSSNSFMELDVISGEFNNFWPHG